MAIFLSNRDGGLTDEQGHYRFQTNVWSGNVIGNGLQVTQNSPLGMSVLVGEGDARIPYSDYAYTPWVDGSETVTIATANPSNPRIDRVVMYIDRSEPRQQVNPNNPGIAKLMAVAGTPGAVPVRPSNVTVQAAVGAGNPYIDLADVRVNAGVTQITNANISDTKTPISVTGSSKHIVVIPGSMFGSTGSINVTGVPFKASLIEFDVIFSFSTTTGTTAIGKCTDTDQFFAYSALSSANQRRGSASSSCIGWDNASGSQIMRASRTSINNDGVTLEVQSANSSFDVAATFHR